LFISPTESLPFGLNFVSKLKDDIDRMKGTKVRVPNNSKFINWHDFIKKGRNYQGIIDSNYVPNEVFEIIYSSGTTNRPKPIQYTNETFTSMVRQVFPNRNRRISYQ
jgi:long-subunit acyl-CoA synthetase (AMP-forming)